MRHIVVCLRSTVLVCVVVVLTGTAFAQESSAPALVIQPGTILTVRINEGLSSDQNQQGDFFSGTLVQPVVVRGIVVAQRGQTVAGSVIEATKAGRVSGTSRLRIALSSLTLVDGQTVPLQSHLVVRNAPSSEGRDVAAIASSTGFGAMIGAAADWGRGAAIGAGAGALAGTIGVLLTRGHATVIYPESALTFQITAPVTVYTDSALQAFHAVNPEVYQQAAPPPPPIEPAPQVAPPPPPPVVYPYPYPYPYPVVYPAPVYYPYYPRVYGPTFSVFFGGYPRYYGYRYRGPRYYVPRHRVVVVPRRGHR